MPKRRPWLVLSASSRETVWRFVRRHWLVSHRASRFGPQNTAFSCERRPFSAAPLVSRNALFDSASSRLAPPQSLVSSVERAIQFRERIAKVVVRRWQVLLKHGDSLMRRSLEVIKQCPEILGAVL
jgi:hypothetical protein